MMKVSRILFLTICTGMLLVAYGNLMPSSAASMGHPRLFFGPNDLQALRIKAATTHQEISQPIKDTAIAQLSQPLRSSKPPDADLDFFRQQSGALMTLAFTCVITEQRDICDRAKRQLLIYASWNHWDVQDQRGLGLAHMVFGNALAYDWLYVTLSTAEQQTVRQSLVNWTSKLYEASNAQLTHDVWQNWWRTAYLQNIYWVTHGALGIAALTLMENGPSTVCTVSADNEVKIYATLATVNNVKGVLKVGQRLRVTGYDFDNNDVMRWHLSNGGWARADSVLAADGCAGFLSDARVWLAEVTDKIAAGRVMLNGIADGSWHEGIPYQNYMLTMSLPFMVSLRRLTGRDIFPHTYLRNYALWRLYNYLPDSTFILPYGDFEWSWAGAYDPPNILRFVAAEYGDRYAEWTAEQIVKAGGRSADVDHATWYIFEFLYYYPAVTAKPPASVPLTHKFPDLEAVIWRTGWNENDLVFGLKSGAYGGRFGFRTFTQGLAPWQPPCKSTGCQFNIGHDHDDTNGFTIYRAGQWLAPENVVYGQPSTADHNTILIDGRGQYRPPDNHYGQIPQDFIGRDGALKEAADTSTFSYLAASATRRYDVPQLKEVTRYVIYVRPDYFVMIDNLAADAPHDYQWVTHFGKTVSIDGNWMRGDAGGGQLLGVAVVSPQPFQITVGHDSYPFVHVKPVSSTAAVRFVHALIPMNVTAWDTRPTVSLLQDNGQAVAVRVKMNDASSRTDDILLTYAPSPVSLTIGPYRYNGRAALIRRGASGKIETISIYGGTFVAQRSSGN